MSFPYYYYYYYYCILNIKYDIKNDMMLTHTITCKPEFKTSLNLKNKAGYSTFFLLLTIPTKTPKQTTCRSISQHCLTSCLWLSAPSSLVPTEDVKKHKYIDSCLKS